MNDAADKATVVAAIPSNKATNYSGSGSTTPDVEAIAMPAALQTVASLQALVNTIESNANQILTGPVTSIPNPGTATSPQIIVVNGDLSLNSSAATGYGLLLVTGTFSACGSTGWNGIVMVIGKGIVSGCGGGSNQFTGAMVVAQIVNPTTGQPLSTLGAPTFNWSGGGGNGIFYSSGCINQASNLYAYKIIASHELLD